MNGETGLDVVADLKNGAGLGILFRHQRREVRREDVVTAHDDRRAIQYQALVPLPQQPIVGREAEVGAGRQRALVYRQTLDALLETDPKHEVGIEGPAAGRQNVEQVVVKLLSDAVRNGLDLDCGQFGRRIAFPVAVVEGPEAAGLEHDDTKVEDRRQNPKRPH